MSDAAFVQLVQHVAQFHITQRSMRAAQDDIERRLQDGETDESARMRYLGAVRAYFSGFEREARAHLKDVDRRLELANQVAFNLNAERGVAAKRVEATRAVLQGLEAVERQSSPV